MDTKKNIFLSNRSELSSNAKIVLAIKMPDGSTELIVNQNALDKLNYVEKAYNDDLKLKTNSNIEIVSYMFYA